jgi:hypothetical protein
MIQTSTLSPLLTAAPKPDQTPQAELAGPAEPSIQVIRNILNFSANLEIKASKLIRHIEVIRS